LEPAVDEKTAGFFVPMRAFSNEMFSWIPDLVMQGITRPE
jgi:hypothetical protein